MKKHIFMLICLFVVVNHVTADWSTDPAVNNVVCNETENQNGVKAVHDGRGGYLYVWGDYRSGSQNDVYAQRIDADGNPQWGANGLCVMDGTNSLRYQKINADGKGGALITWKDTTADEVYMQRVSADGTLLWGTSGVTVFGSTIDGDCAFVVPDGTGGGYVPSWNGYMQYVNADGNLLWGDASTPGQYSTDTSSQSAKLIPLGTNGVIVVWLLSTDGNIYIQRFDSSGDPVWNSGSAIALSSDGASGCPRIIRNGNYVYVAWENASSELPVQKIAISDGTCQWTDPDGVVVSTDTTSGGSTHGLVYDGSGGVLVSWASNISNDITVQGVNADGTIKWASDTVLPSSSNVDTNYNLAMRKAIEDGEGGLITFWVDATSYEITAQRVDKDGAEVWASPVTVSTAAVTPYCYQIMTNGQGSGVITWCDQRDSGTTGSDVYTQAVTKTGELAKPEYTPPSSGGSGSSNGCSFSGSGSFMFAALMAFSVLALALVRKHS